MTRTPASATEKILHWSVATAVLLMVATGGVMYIPSLSEIVGQRFWVRTVHIASAAAFVLVLLLVPALRWPEIRRLERDLSFWDRADWDWFSRPWAVFVSTYQPADVPRRFNGGQKLLAALVAISLALLLVTGVPMYWWSWFSSAFVSRARDFHVLAALALAALLAGHIYLGLASPYGLLQSRIERNRVRR